MFCRKCGQQNPDDAAHCAKCGEYLVAVDAPKMSTNPYQAPMQMAALQLPLGMEKPSSYLPLAIISTVCCGCLPLGIVSIVFAAQVDSKWNAGDFSGAQNSSEKAKMFGIISIVVGIVLGVGMQLLRHMR